MNPDNDALKRTLFLGGPPRVGKSLLAYALAKEVGGHVVSTDSIRAAAAKAKPDRTGSLFVIHKAEKVEDAEWIATRAEHPEEVVELQNRESRAFWRSIVGYCNTFVEDDAVHIVEGVVLLPSLVAEMKNRPEHIAYVGNTSETHVDAMLAHARDFPQRDWMSAMGYSEDKIKAMAHFVRAMSEYLKTEAEKYGFPYYELRDADFDVSLAETVTRLTSETAPKS